MLINREVDLPDDLISARRAGRLVVFAGAGVSMGPPSNLPSFETLTSAVAGGVLLQRDGEPFDAFLGRLEESGVNVQARTREQIDVPASSPNLLHSLIVDL